MHKCPQNQRSVGSSGQTLTTDVSMTPGDWQICHQTHVLPLNAFPSDALRLPASHAFLPSQQHDGATVNAPPAPPSVDGFPLRVQRETVMLNLPIRRQMELVSQRDTHKTT